MSALTDRSSALFAALAAADADGVRAALCGASEAEREPIGTQLVRLEARRDSFGHYAVDADGSLRWVERTGPAEPPETQLETDQAPLVHVAIMGTATPKQMRRVAWALSWVDDALAATVLLDRGPPWLQSWAQWLLTTQTMQVCWPLVRDLVRAGAIERPAAYIPALLRMRWWEEQPLSAMLDADPEFWERDVWDLIAYAGEDASQRAADVCGWSTLIAERVRERDRLLDALLEPLPDLSAYRAAWYTKVWKTLKPTNAERTARATELRELLGATAEPVVGFALEELTRAGVPLAAEELAPALAVSTKKTVRAALAQLDREPALAVIALAHPDADIQGEVLGRLETWGLDDAARAALLRDVERLAASQRPRAEALLGVVLPTVEDAADAPVVDVDSIPEAIRRALNFGGPVPDAPVPGEPVLAEPMPRPAALEALGPNGWSLGEGRTDAVLRACDQEPPDALVEHLDEAATYYDAPVRLLYAWRYRTPAPPRDWSNPSQHELEERVARRAAGALLALPTHEGGWIEPLALVERMHPNATEEDLTAALLRLAPQGREAALAAAAAVSGRHGALLRCALGGAPVPVDGTSAASAARAVAGLDAVEIGVWDPRAVFPERFDAVWDAEDPDAAYDALMRDAQQHRRWFAPAGATDFPARRDVAAAHILDGREWPLYGDAVALLAVVLAPSEPLPREVLAVVLCALSSESDRERLLAADVLVAAIEDGRADAGVLAPALRLRPDLTVPNRLAAQLAAVADVGPWHRAVVLELLDSTVDVLPRPTALLGLFDELCARTASGPDRSRAFLATLKGSSKAARSAKALLARSGPVDAADWALAARVRRARRWMEP